MRFLGTVTIFVALALSWMVVSAHAKDVVPQQFRGNWCGQADDPEYVRTPKPCAADESTNPLKVTADTVDGCKVTMVDRYRPRDPDYIVRLKCGDAPTELYWLRPANGGKLYFDKFHGGGYR